MPPSTLPSCQTGRKTCQMPNWFHLLSSNPAILGSTPPSQLSHEKTFSLRLAPELRTQILPLPFPKTCSEPLQRSVISHHTNIPHLLTMQPCQQNTFLPFLLRTFLIFFLSLSYRQFLRNDFHHQLLSSHSLSLMYPLPPSFLFRYNFPTLLFLWNTWSVFISSFICYSFDSIRNVDGKRGYWLWIWER